MSFRNSDLHLPLLAAAILCGIGGLLSAQEGPPIGPQPSAFRHTEQGARYRAVHVSGATEACVVLAIGVGSRHDPAGQSGLAAVIGRLFARQDAALPEWQRRQFGVHGECTVVSGRAKSPGQLDALLESMVALVDGSLTESLSDDAIELALGDALLVADDAADVYPGEVLETAARERVFGHRPWRGRPKELEQLTPKQVRARLAARYRAKSAVLVVFSGFQSRAETEAGLAKRLDGLAAGQVAELFVPDADRAVPKPDAVTRVVSHRVADPYVAAAFAAPAMDAETLPAFLIALELINGSVVRATYATDPRRAKQESRARLRPLVWRYSVGDRLVMIQRRARDGFDAASTRADLAKLLAALRESPLDPRAAGRASARLTLQFQQPPYGEPQVRQMARSAVGMYPFARSLAIGEVLGWPKDLPYGLHNTRLSQALDGIRAALDPAHLRWVTIEPPPK